MNRQARSIDEDSRTDVFELTYSATLPLPGDGDEAMARDAAKKLVRDGHATLLAVE